MTMIRVIKISRRPGFSYTHGGWSVDGTAEIRERLALMRGPKRPQVVEEPRRETHSELFAKALEVDLAATTIPRRDEPPFFAVGPRDVVLAAIAVVAFWLVTR